MYETWAERLNRLKENAGEVARRAYPDAPYYGGRSAQRLFAEGYKQAINDIEKELNGSK